MRNTCPDNSGAPPERALERLKELIIRRTGMSYFASHDGRLIQAVHERMRHGGLDNYDEYYGTLNRNRDGNREFEALASALTIGETYFFRGAEQIDWLVEHAVPERIRQRGPNRELRIWCAGCSSGAEPYSIAIRLHHDWGNRLRGWRVRIVATDINRELLQRAAKGVFSRWELRGMPDRPRDRYFEAEGTEWRLRDDYRPWVDFQWHNLVEDPVPSITHGIADFDIVLCRNVMIYFDTVTTERIVQRLAGVIATGGWLMTGASDPFAVVRRHVKPDGPAAAFAFRKHGRREAWRIADTGTRPAWIPPVLSAISTAEQPTEVVTPTRSAAEAPVPVVRDNTANTPSLDAARQHMDGGEWQHAKELLEKHEPEWREMSDFHVLSGMLHEHLEQPDAALQSYRTAIYLNRDDPVAEFHLGRAALRAGRDALAARSFRNAAKIAHALDRLESWPELLPDRLADMATTQLELMDR